MITTYFTLGICHGLVAEIDSVGLLRASKESGTRLENINDVHRHKSLPVVTFVQNRSYGCLGSIATDRMLASGVVESILCHVGGGPPYLKCPILLFVYFRCLAAQE